MAGCMLRLLRLRQVVIAAAVGVSSCLGGGQSPRLLWVASCLGRQGGCGRWPRLRLWPLTGGWLHQLWWVTSCSRQLQGGIAGMSSGGFSFWVAAAAVLWWLAAAVRWLAAAARWLWWLPWLHAGV